jgi:hypothetical protein
MSTVINSEHSPEDLEDTCNPCLDKENDVPEGSRRRMELNPEHSIPLGWETTFKGNLFIMDQHGQMDE